MLLEKLSTVLMKISKYPKNLTTSTHTNDNFVFSISPMTVFIYSSKKDTSDFHGAVSFDPVKMSLIQLRCRSKKINENVYQMSDTHKLVIYLILSSYLEELLNLKLKQLFPLSSAS